MEICMLTDSDTER